MNGQGMVPSYAAQSAELGYGSHWGCTDCESCIVLKLQLKIVYHNKMISGIEIENAFHHHWPS